MRMFDIVLTVIIQLARIFITLEYFRIFLDCRKADLRKCWQVY